MISTIHLVISSGAMGTGSMGDLSLGYLGTLGMRTNPETQPIRAPRRVDFSAK